MPSSKSLGRLLHSREIINEYGVSAILQIYKNNFESTAIIDLSPYTQLKKYNLKTRNLIPTIAETEILNDFESLCQCMRCEFILFIEDAFDGKCKTCNSRKKA